MSENSPRVYIHPDFDVLAATTAARLITKLLDRQNERGDATVVLTGGRVGIAMLKAVADSPAREAVDWSKVNVWWGDERFLPAGDPERNDQQAREALLDQVGVDPSRVHSFPTPADGDLETCAALYAEKLAEQAVITAGDSLDVPLIDICLLGVGPDAHIASLFPDQQGITVENRTVVAEEHSPKPPAERLSLTLPVINAAKEVWLIVAGEDKAGAVGLALAGANKKQVPAAGARGRRKTLWLIDQDAAAKVPDNLILPAVGERW